MFASVRPAAAAVVTAVMLSAGLVDLSAAPAANAGVGWIAIEPVAGVMLPQTQFTVIGRLANKTPRTVTLQKKVGSGTSSLARVASRPDGTFEFSGVRLSASAQVRTVTARQTVRVASGPKARARHRKALKNRVAADKRLRRVVILYKSGRTHGGKLRQAKFRARLAKKRVIRTRQSLTRLVTVKRAESRWTDVKVVAKQSVRSAALPPVAQAGALPQAPASGNVIAAGFVPPRHGRPVTLEQLVDDAWAEVDTGRQDASGHGVFSVERQGTYRVRTKATVEAPEVVGAPVTTRAWVLDFEDEFTGKALDSAKWGVQHRARGTGFRSCARTDDSSYTVAGGVLRMGVSKDPRMSGKTCAYTDEDGVKHRLPYMRNTQIATEGRYDFRHGFAAARVKTQAAVGMHSAFWINGNQPAVAGRPDLGTEVDVFEYFGNRSRENGVAAFVHVLQKNGVTTKQGAEFDSTVLMKGPKKFYQEFHVFSVEWTPTSYVFRLDGREFHRVSRNISQVNQHMVLSNLTSSYELVDLVNVKDVAQVDWVRVWK